jgi:hypothetical protein
MRSDMAKVIVERPRKKGWAWHKPKGYLRRLRRYGDDGPPAREGIKACWQGGTKYLNEHLGPLRRYLDKQVGRPWDKVFSEICAHINRTSAVQDHVRDHVEDYVTVHVLLIDRVPCSGEGDWNHGRPLHQMPWKRWYVCPRTGILKKIKARTRPCRGGPSPDDSPRYVQLSDVLQCRRIKGVWHLVTLKPLPLAREKCLERDVVLNRSVARVDEELAQRYYGAPVFAVAKRPLARRELRQLPVPVDAWR